MMKTLYMIGGTMGVGKTTVCQQLKQDLPNSVFLDGDWCWDASPFQVTDETKAMVTNNICYLLNNFLKCSAYDNTLLMHHPTKNDILVCRTLQKIIEYITNIICHHCFCFVGYLERICIPAPISVKKYAIR